MIHPLDLPGLRARFQAEIDHELIRQRTTLSEVGSDTKPLVDLIEALLRGGKRLRAAFCYCGYVAAGGQDEAAAIRAAVAMEFFQAAALLHDDVMDNSAIRRGRPSAHRALAAQHRNAGWDGDSDRFGVAGAILAGDLCLVWTDDLLASCGWPAAALARARPVFDAMRTQLMGGQFLDVLAAAQGWEGRSLPERLDLARRVIRYKSAKYSIEQPLLIGANAAEVSRPDQELLSRYGLDLGEAFQLRDDVLGVFGDPRQTGKPAGDDLREGKLTMLLALALDQADGHQSATLIHGLGRADLEHGQVLGMQQAILDTGAVDRLEERIAGLAASARGALFATTGLTDPGRTALEQLIEVATARES